MKTGSIICLGLVLAAPPAMAAPATEKPTLLVAIAVDQFGADLFAEYRPLFRSGLKRLSGGVVFPSGYQSHAATDTCPGHATILTGARPARSGIIGNHWIDQSIERADKRVYCAEDVDAPGSSSDRYTPSIRHLKVPTLGDRLKAQDARSRVVAVAGKDRSALMMGGGQADQIWFFSGDKLSTLPDRRSPVPASVARVNQAVAETLAAPVDDPLPAACTARAVATMVTPDLSVGISEPRKPSDVAGFRRSPDFDRQTANLAIGLIAELGLGSGDATDLLTIGFSGTDDLGHARGSAGSEMCAQLLALDETIGRVLAALDQTGAHYAVVLTADHGIHDLPERNRLRGMSDAVRVDPDLNAGAVSRTIARELGLPIEPPVILGSFAYGDWYLNTSLPARDRERVLAAAVKTLRAHPQVAAAIPARSLVATARANLPPDEWTLEQRAQASFYSTRSGDIILLLKPYVSSIPTPSWGVTTHGSPWDYDRRVPILFWWPGSPNIEQPLPVETVDILPTLAALIDLPIAASEIDGRCLDLDPGPADSCD